MLQILRPSSGSLPIGLGRCGREPVVLAWGVRWWDCGNWEVGTFAHLSVAPPRQRARSASSGGGFRSVARIRHGDRREPGILKTKWMGSSSPRLTKRKSLFYLPKLSRNSVFFSSTSSLKVGHLTSMAVSLGGFFYFLSISVESLKNNSKS
jgi:hypothetical protein